jgi:hypothetical protein
MGRYLRQITMVTGQLILFLEKDLLLMETLATGQIFLDSIMKDQLKVNLDMVKYLKALTLT